jgi:putative transposase
MKEIITLLSCIAPIIENKTQKQLGIIIQALLSMRGRITMLGLSRWSEKGGSYRTIGRFFHSEINWEEVNWRFIKKHLIKKKNIYLLGGDEVVISKDGKHSYGLDLFYSSLENRVKKSLAFLNLSLISVEDRKAYPLINKQIIRENKEGCVKDKSSKVKKKKQKGKRGRPKGSGNKDKKDVKLPPYLEFVQKYIKEAVQRIDKELNIIYFVYDGAFGNNNAVQMVKRCGLDIISKLQKNSALIFPNEEPYSGKGAPKKYGDNIDYKNLPEKYLKSDEIDEDKNIQTKIYQMKMLHRKFADILNIVIIQKTNIVTNNMTYIVLFTTDLSLSYEKIIDYYSLRFQIEFIFRDAKQYWGMEDFMNIKKTAIYNWTNLSTFMVNFTHGLRKNSAMKDMSILDLKAHYHGIKYVKEVFKLLPNLVSDYLIKKVSDKIANLGAIHPTERVA